MTNIDFPFRIDNRGHTAAPADADKHVRDLIEQLLFTSPGERVNRPDFGCGLLGLCFEGNSSVLATTLQSTIQAALLRWLGDVIEVQAVRADSQDSTLAITVAYTIRRTEEKRVDRFVRPGEGQP